MCEQLAQRCRDVEWPENRVSDFLIASVALHHRARHLMFIPVFLLVIYRFTIFACSLAQMFNARYCCGYFKTNSKSLFTSAYNNYLSNCVFILICWLQM